MSNLLMSPVRRSQKASYAIMFANFCIHYDVAPGDLATLMLSLKKVVRLGVPVSNGENGDKEYFQAMNKFETMATELGFEVKNWPGLYPVLRRNDRDIYEFPLE